MLNVQPIREKETIYNDGLEPITVCLEPWGDDYTLLTGESLDIIVDSESRRPSFDTRRDGAIVSVYVDAGGQDPRLSVEQDGTSLECGHNRQYGPLAEQA